MNKLDVSSSPQIYYLLSHHNPHSSYFRDIINNHEFLIKKLYQPGDLILVEENWNKKEFTRLKIPNLSPHEFNIQGWDDVDEIQLHSFLALKFQIITAMSIIDKVDEYISTYRTKNLRGFLFKDSKVQEVNLAHGMTSDQETILNNLYDDIKTCQKTLRKHASIANYELLETQTLQDLKALIKNSYMHAYGYLGAVSPQMENPLLTWNDIKKYILNNFSFCAHIENNKQGFFRQIKEYLANLKNQITDKDFQKRQNSLLARVNEALLKNPHRKVFALMGTSHGDMQTTPYKEVVSSHLRSLSIKPIIINIEQMVKEFELEVSYFSKEPKEISVP